MPAETSVPIEGEASIVIARQSARMLAKELGFSAVDQSRIATAVSELARNVVRYATGGQGQMTLRVLPRSTRGVGLQIVVADDGPGIENVEQALAEGFTSGRGMGLGLPGTRRLMDEMTIESTLGRGTTVTICKWHR